MLKNDDAEDSEDEEHDDDAEAEAERKQLEAESAKRMAAEKQPTGRIVGMIKRNWRSCVLQYLINYQLLIRTSAP